MTSAMFMDGMFLSTATPGGGGCFPHNNPWNTTSTTPTALDPWSTTPKNTTPSAAADSPLLLSSVWTPLKKDDHHHHHGDEKDDDAWNKSPSSNYKDIMATAPQIPTLLSLRPPETISFRADEEDDVSVLNDNPDEDDAAILPQPTYDVLANIFDELYKDESEIDEEDDKDDFPDGACAA
jgi:hypothetical protein